jgi:hypothetical protein
VRYVLVPLSATVLASSATYSHNPLLYSCKYTNYPIGAEDGLYFTDGMAETLLISVNFTAAVLAACNYSIVPMRFLLINTKVALLTGLF